MLIPLCFIVPVSSDNGPCPTCQALQPAELEGDLAELEGEPPNISRMREYVFVGVCSCVSVSMCVRVCIYVCICVRECVCSSPCVFASEISLTSVQWQAS